MKNLKKIFILVSINIMLIFSINYSNEVIDKNGNSTTFKLNQDEEINIDDSINDKIDNVSLGAIDTSVTSSTSYSRPEYSTGNGYMGWEASYDKTYYEPYSIPDTNKANISVNKIKMRQDDNYYYIDFNVDYKLEDLALNSYRIIGKKKDGTEITDYYETSESGNIVITDNETKGFRFQLNISQAAYSYTSDNWPPKIYNYSAAVKLQDGTNESKSAKYYDNNSIKTYGGPISKIVAGLPYVFYTDTIGTNTPLYKNNNATITNYKTKRLNDEYYNFNYTGTFKIPKTEKDKFNVLQLYNPRAREQSHSSNITYAQLNGNNGVYNPANNETRTWITIYGEAVDISQYYKCKHEDDPSIWKIKQCNSSDHHIQYCPECQWEKEQPHNFIYEYDGIKNNLCSDCLGTKQVNYYFEINDDNNTIINKTYNSYSNSDTYTYNKRGYKLKHYELYEKRFENETNPLLSDSNTPIKEKYIKNVATIDNKTENYSRKYIAISEPIKYKFIYSPISNINILNKATRSQIFNYDTKYKLYEPYDVANYGFKGWSLTKGSDNVDFYADDEIYNYTDIEGKEYILYPVYSNNSNDITYTFNYSPISNIKVLNEATSSQIFKFNEEQELNDHIKVDKYGFKGWSLTQGSDKIDFSPKQKILNYTKINKRVYTLYPVYGAIEYTFKYSNDNNKNLTLNKTLQDQVFSVGTEGTIQDHIPIEGYGLLGWSLTQGSDNIDFSPKEKIYNYTDIEGQVYTLYPVYENLSFTITYNTTYGTFDNGKTKITKNYNYNEIFSIEKINTPKEKQSGEYYTYFTKKYIDQNNNIFKTSKDIKKYINDLGICNYVLNLNADIRSSKRGTDSGGGTGRIDNIKTYDEDDNKKETKENNDINNNNEIVNDINNNKKIEDENKKKEDDKKRREEKLDKLKDKFTDLFNTIYDDFNDLYVNNQNTDSENQNQSNDNKKQLLLYEYLKNVYEDFDYNVNFTDTDIEMLYNTNIDIVNVLNDIYTDFVDINNISENEIVNYLYAFSESFEEEEIEEETKSNNNENIATKSNIKKKENISYINKVFKKQVDKNKIKNIIIDLQNRDYEKIYNNFYNGEYEELVNNFINDNEFISKEFKTEYSKEKYKEFANSIIEDFKDKKYESLIEELNENNEKYKKQYNEIVNLLKNYDYKTLLTNLNNGKYKQYINEIKNIITKEEYQEMLIDYLNEFIDGKYEDIFYDTIYNFFEITYKYSDNNEIKETKDINEIREIEIVNEEEIKKPPIILFIGIALLLLIIIIAIILLKKNKKEE